MAEYRGTSSAAAGTKPRIGLTIGDPAGVGPEVTLKAALEEEVLAVCAPVIIGDAQYLSHWARVFGLNRGFDCINVDDPIPLEQNTPIIYNLNNIPGSIEMGREQAECGRAAANSSKPRPGSVSQANWTRWSPRPSTKNRSTWRDTLSRVTRSF